MLFRSEIVNHRPKKQETFFLTNGSSTLVPAQASFSSPMVYYFHKEEKMDVDEDCGYWSFSVEKIKWDTMFQDLKPN